MNIRTHLATALLLWIAASLSTHAVAFTSAQAAPQEDQCFACHDAIGDKASTGYKKDIHFAKGISCADCHGGDRTSDDKDAAMNSRKGYIGIPRKNVISQRCARCHDDAEAMKRYGFTGTTGQFAALAKSVHGKASSIGDDRIVQCTTCHGQHGIQRTDNPASPIAARNIVATCTRCHGDANYMKQYNPSLPVDQLEKYRTSVHGMKNAAGDSRVAHCASCHGAHDIHRATDAISRVNVFNIPQTCSTCHSDAQYMKPYNIPTNQYAQFTTSVHGIALLKKKDAGAPSCNKCHGNHGAAPPGVTSISNVCGTCHTLNSQLFSQSTHKNVFDEKGLPECETCHGKHDINPATEALLSLDRGSACGRCHSATEAPNGFKAANIMLKLIDSLQQSEKRAKQILHAAEQKGIEVSEAMFKLRDARQARLESRTMVHAFDLKKFNEVLNKGLTITSLATDEADAALDDYYFRRWGLGVSTLIITTLIVGLALYIRRIEKKQNA